MSRWSMMKNIHSPNMVGIGSWGPEIWPHEYLLSPIENQCKLAWFQQPIIDTEANGAIYTVLGIHVAISWATMNRFMSNLVVWRFFIMLFRNMVMKMLKCKQKIFDDVTHRYSIEAWIQFIGILHSPFGQLLEALLSILKNFLFPLSNKAVKDMKREEIYFVLWWYPFSLIMLPRIWYHSKRLIFTTNTICLTFMVINSSFCCA